MSDNRTALSDQVARELERRTLLGEFAPGEALPGENALGEMLGVSRTVVREALKILSARDLVQIRHGVGAKVAEPTPVGFARALLALLMRSDVSMGDVMEARAVIETHVGVLASGRGTAVDFNAIAAALEQFRDAVERQAWRQAFRHHGAFHVRILKATRMPALVTILSPMQDIIALSSLPPAIEEASFWNLSGHERILDALIARDADAVRAALETHFAGLMSDDYADMRQRPFREVVNHVVLGPDDGWELNVPDTLGAAGGRATTDGDAPAS